MKDDFWIIVNSDKDLLLVGRLFQSGTEAHNYAGQHMHNENWRVIKIKFYEVL